MIDLSEFNVYMQPYGESTGGGGNGGNGDAVVNLAGATTDPAFAYVGSNYNFTNPPRYYKANDPYYYEIDNIPLKQIHENCMWLKDQIEGVSLSVTGVSTSQILDLQPFSTNADRQVTVRPGKFIGRVNDAYNLTNISAPTSQPATIDINRTPIFKNPSTQINTDVFRSLVGSELTTMLYSNGLYDHLQHHASRIINPSISPATGVNDPLEISYSFVSDYLQSASNGILDLPKIKTAVWKQLSNTLDSEPPFRVDLQQLSVDFCRRWQGVFRTSVVNIPEALEVSISPFDETDYVDNDSTYDPLVRIDLVFAYTKPIDANLTNIARNNGDVVEQITSPRLGVAKGAGGVLTGRSFGGANPAEDIGADPGKIGDAAWVNQGSDSARYYNTEQNLTAEQDIAMQAPLADQVALYTQGMPFPGKGTGLSFPSPDDLMNLAPLITQDFMDNQFATVGQSVLPICYVIVKKGEAIITSDDIIDIRPFLRTAELTYNERAGIGAANPPLSLANPTVGKHELYNAIELVRNLDDAKITNFIDLINAQMALLPIAKPTLTGTYRANVYGNASWQGITLREISTQSNSPPMPDAYSAMLPGSTTFFPTTGEESDGKIRCVPGRYLFEATFHAQNYDYGDHNAFTKWEMRITNNGDNIFPSSDSNRPTFKCFTDHGNARFEETGGASFSCILDIPEINDAGGEIQAVIARKDGSSGQNCTIHGTLRITRIANLSGSEGPVGT